MQTDRVQRGGVWYATVAPGARRLFRGRRYRQLALGDDRVVVSAGRRQVLLDSTLEELELTRVRNGILLQVLAHDPTSRTHIFEFRPRRHAAGHAFADALR